MIKKIHVNQHNIRKNTKTGGNLPVITVKTYKSNDYCNDVEILGPSKIVSIYGTATCPLSCGAKVWIETRASVRLDNEEIIK